MRRKREERGEGGGGRGGGRGGGSQGLRFFIGATSAGNKLDHGCSYTTILQVAPAVTFE